MSTLSTPALDQLWPSLLTEHGSLLKQFGGRLAAPFWSAADKNYRKYDKRFMLVGRATREAYDYEEFRSQLDKSPADALIDRKELNRRLVRKHPNSPFWRAFEKGSESCGEAEAYEMRSGRT